jgi:hypothetical protein
MSWVTDQIQNIRSNPFDQQALAYLDEKKSGGPTNPELEQQIQQRVAEVKALVTRVNRLNRMSGRGFGRGLGRGAKRRRKQAKRKAQIKLADKLTLPIQGSYKLVPNLYPSLSPYIVTQLSGSNQNFVP